MVVSGLESASCSECSAGGCVGFRLDGLLKFMETKAQDGTTLLHYLSGTIMKKSPELVDFYDEISW